jgi:hypothetical protein
MGIKNPFALFSLSLAIEYSVKVVAEGKINPYSPAAMIFTRAGSSRWQE